MSKREAESNPSEKGADQNPPIPSDGKGHENVEELKARASKADEHWERLLRTTADFDNFKKRAAREKTEAIQFANAALMQKLLPVLDNFEMALQAAESVQDEKLAPVKSGVLMIQQQLRGALAESGLEEVNAAGKPFDPALHEAVSQQESQEIQEGHVLQQLRKGYRLKERLLRPASVVVAKAASTSAKDSQAA